MQAQIKIQLCIKHIMLLDVIHIHEYGNCHLLS